LFTLLLGIAAGLALVGVLRRRRHPAQEKALPDQRAEELARKLAETRAEPPTGVHEGDSHLPVTGSGADAAEPKPPVEAEIDETRRRVHEEGRSTVDEMRRSGDLPA
jgi:hypothetical protein